MNQIGSRMIYDEELVRLIISVKSCSPSDIEYFTQFVRRYAMNQIGSRMIYDEELVRLIISVKSCSPSDIEYFTQFVRRYAMNQIGSRMIYDEELVRLIISVKSCSPSDIEYFTQFVRRYAMNQIGSRMIYDEELVRLIISVKSCSPSDIEYFTQFVRRYAMNQIGSRMIYDEELVRLIISVKSCSPSDIEYFTQFVRRYAMNQIGSRMIYDEELVRLIISVKSCSPSDIEYFTQFVRRYAMNQIVCEEVCDEPNLFEDGLGFMANIHTLDEVRELVKQPERLTGLEERVKAWIRKVQEVIMESQQLRKENDSSGPQDELEYWKKRGAQFSQIVSHLQCHEHPPPAVTLVSPPQVQMTLQCLHVARSKMIKHWRDTDRHITFCYNESRDNAKFIQSMEKCCHSLYLHDPVRIKDSIMGLLQTVRLIHSVSQYYNTSERTSSLMVKVSVGRTAETDRSP
uniref:Dynein heavy chain tail domain-containing protein n=1 Tax=Timema shepardi TaxID=629360 RepID=A0A7R9AR20_TIMSH|nr:unnamed protein product [Timema shepardi]